MICGFIGTGTITAAMVEGLSGSAFPLDRILVSPRNPGIAAGLAARFERVEVAASNQAVADGASLLVLAVRPQVAEEVLRDLSLAAESRVVSLIAATPHAQIAKWTGLDPRAIVRAIPLPFVARREGVTVLFPPDPVAEALFGALGTAVACQTQQEFDLLAAASAVMGSYFGLQERLADWLIRQGLPAEKAEGYLRALFASLATEALLSPEKDLAALREAFSTRGGLNEQVFADLERLGGTEALAGAMDRVLARIRG